MVPAPQDGPAPNDQGRCLHSWKEIATYLDCSVVTAQRWEKLEGLPVRRHFHNRLGSAYAYVVEIDRWLDQRAPRTLPSATPAAQLATTAAKPMLAVLPFENLTGDANQEYFSDGLTEETITEIGHLYADRMGVIARTSVMRYKSTRKRVRRIAQELGVGYVLEGSVRRAESRVRVAVQLIDGSDETHVWAQVYERPIGDILTIQGDIARAVAEKVEVKVDSSPRPQQISNSEAFECYLKGRFHWYKLSREDFDIALRYFQLAVEKDASCALGYAGIADVWWIRGDNGIIPAREANPNAMAAVSKALELDDSLADIHVTLANGKFGYDWDWRGAEAEFQRGITLNPNSAHGHFMYADFLFAMRRFDQGSAEMEQVLQLDPFNFFFQCFLGWHLLYRRRDDDAIAHLRRVCRAEPGLAAAHLGLWGAYHRKGKVREALAEARTFYRLLGDNEVAETLTLRPGARCDYARAMRRAADKLAARSRYTFVPGIRIARLYAHAEDHPNALQWLEKAYEGREPPLVHVSVGWDWDDLRSEPCFQELLRRMNFPQ